MVYDKVAYASIKGHEWEVSSHVVVHYARVFIGKCAKAEYVGDRLIVDVTVCTMLWFGATYAMLGSFHVSFSRRWTLVEVF